MPISNMINNFQKNTDEKRQPPGRIKIVNALISLLEQKEFGAITTAEIAKNAGVTEALIYKYFKDKRDLMHQVLTDYLEQFHIQLDHDLKGIKGAINKLRKLIWTHFNVYANNRVFAKILLIEVRNHKDYYHSETYEVVKIYSDFILKIIEEGIDSGEIRDKIPPVLIRQGIFGCIEHVCLSDIIFDREIDPDVYTEDLCEFIFGGIEKK